MRGTDVHFHTMDIDVRLFGILMRTIRHLPCSACSAGTYGMSEKSMPTITRVLIIAWTQACRVLQKPWPEGLTPLRMLVKRDNTERDEDTSGDTWWWFMGHNGCLARGAKRASDAVGASP